jgi:hypothetical protein
MTVLARRRFYRCGVVRALMTVRSSGCVWGSGLLAALLVCSGVAWASRIGRIVHVSSPNGFATEPDLGVDARGDQTVVWIQESLNNPEQYEVMDANRLAGSGRWSTPTSISGVHGPTDQAVVSLAPSGAGVAAWSEDASVPPASNMYVIDVTTRRSAAAPWRPPVQIAQTSVSAGTLSVGIDRGGDATVVWSGQEGTNAIEVAQGSATTGQWGGVRQLAAAGQGGSELQLAVDNGGDSLVAWQRLVGRTGKGGEIGEYREMIRYRTRGGAWQPATSVGRLSLVLAQPSDGVSTPATPRIALSGRGDATVIWESIHRKGYDTALFAAHRSSSQARWQHPAEVSGNAVAGVLGSDAHGDLTIAWDTARSRMFVTTSSDGMHWSSPVLIASAANLSSLLVGQRGDAVLTWGGQHRGFVSSRTRPGAKWSRPASIPGVGGPQAELNPPGTATLMWPQLQGGRSVIDTTTYTSR